MQSNSFELPPVSDGFRDEDQPLLDEEVDTNEELTPAELSLHQQRKATDLHLFHQWNNDKSKKNLGALLTNLHPIIYKSVSRAGSSLPKAALEAEAKVWAIKGIDSFDPSRGVALSTHIANYLKRVRRLNYQHQNMARMSENKHLQFHDYNKAVQQLTDLHNREPTEDEMAHKLGWSKGQVVSFSKLIQKDHFEGKSEAASQFEEYSDSALLMRELMSHLTPDEKFILENKGVMPSSALAKKLGVDLNRFNYMQKKLIDKIRIIKNQIGMP